MATATKRDVLLYNDDDNEYVEDYNGTLYKIPAHGAIKLARRDAISLRGTYPGKHVVKRLRIDNDLSGVITEESHQCNFCGETFGNEQLLANHLESHKDKRVEPMIEMKCPLCGDVFDNLADLRDHLVDVEDLNQTQIERQWERYT